MKLELTFSTWLAFAAVAGLWACSIYLTKDPASRQGWTWRSIPLSFFGLAWIAFGFTFILRFLLLVYDPVLFRATQFPLWQLPPAAFPWLWMVIGLFWLAFTTGYLLVTRLSPYRPMILGKLDLLGAPGNSPTLDILVFCCACLVILSGRGFVPRALDTPLAILGGFYAMAATAAWFSYFQTGTGDLRRFFYLLPGLFVYFFSPFRALIFAVVLCIVVPALKTRRWVSLATFLLVMVSLLILTTIVNDYRRAQMQAEISTRGDASLEGNWWENPGKTPWVRLGKRFHGFDSVALTMHFVPSFFPHSHINIFTDLFWRLIPRSIADKKADTHRGRAFSTTIWAMGTTGLTKRQEANISPTMCADLYQINGIPLVMVGAAFYGLLVGLLESWQRRGGLLSSSIFLVLFGMPVALGIEQEFNFAAATLLQVIIGFFLFLLFLPIFTRSDMPKKFVRDSDINRQQ